MWQQGSPRAEEGAEPDQLVLAGPLDQLLARPLPAGAERVALELDSSVSSYADYLDGYTRARARSATALQAIPESRESLLDCARANAFCRVRVDGEPAGFIAARPGHFRIHAGWEMVDELLLPEFQGQGLGPAMQRVFLQSLERARAEFVFGTIAAANQPSLRTALRVGRSVVESGVFFLLPVPGGERA